MPKYLFKKGNKINLGRIPWNKGKKGVMPVPWNKGIPQSQKTKIKISNSKKGKPCFNGFKKEHIPWSKGKKLPHLTGKNACHWKGGKTIDRNGYTHIYNPNHPSNGKKVYVLRSHLVIEKILNRFLEKSERVHHINSNTSDDRPENLILFKNQAYHILFFH